MRCLYCGIKLKIAKKAALIRHCPECSMRLESDLMRESLLRVALLNLKARQREPEMRVRKAAASSVLHH
jgi:hypothetical protein